MQNYPRVFRNFLDNLTVAQITKLNDFLKDYPIFIMYAIIMDKTKCLQVVNDAETSGTITTAMADVMRAKINQDTPQP